MNEIKVEGSEAGEALVAQGHTIQRSQVGFTTAVTVQKPRQRAYVLAACEEEAMIAGDEFMYAWPIKDKAGKTKIIEGPSVQLALTAVRNWGNCGVHVDVTENATHCFFTATFVDLETGFNLQRVFRQRKNQDMGKRMDKDRAEDTTFQIGQSKAIRNVVVNALPSWLIEKMKTKAKENIVAKIETMGVAKAKEKALEHLLRYGIDEQRIELRLGRKAKSWDAKDLALLHGAIKTLNDGMENPEDLFPAPEGKKTDTVKPAAERNPAPKKKKPAPAAKKKDPPEPPEDTGTPEGESDGTLYNRLSECDNNEQRIAIWKKINSAYQDNILDDTEYASLSKINNTKAKQFQNQKKKEEEPQPLNDNCEACVKFPCPSSGLKGPSNLCGMGKDEEGNTLISIDERSGEQQNLVE